MAAQPVGRSFCSYYGSKISQNKVIFAAYIVALTVLILALALTNTKNYVRGIVGGTVLLANIVVFGLSYAHLKRLPPPQRPSPPPPPPQPAIVPGLDRVDSLEALFSFVGVREGTPIPLIKDHQNREYADLLKDPAAKPRAGILQCQKGNRNAFLIPVTIVNPNPNTSLYVLIFETDTPHTYELIQLTTGIPGTEVAELPMRQTTKSPAYYYLHKILYRDQRSTYLLDIKPSSLIIS